MIKNKGAVLIVVMWIISISIVFVSVMVKNTKLSSTLVMKQQQGLNNWSKMLNAINLAKVEILLRQSTVSSFGGGKKNFAGNQDIELKRIFSGHKVKLSFENYDDIIVRFYDLSGKINLSNINRASLKKILEHKLKDNTDKIEALLDAWQDWTDKDNLKRLNGAETPYYKTLESPYSSRNGPIQSVNELHLIKGFSEAFSDIDFTQIFTMYGVRQPKINPNIASKETLLFVPGIDEKLANEIISARNNQPFDKIADFKAIIPAEVASKVNPWFGLTKSKFYEIVIYSQDNEKNAQINPDGSYELYVYREIIQVINKNLRPKTLRVYPSYKMSFNKQVTEKQQIKI